MPKQHIVQNNEQHLLNVLLAVSGCPHKLQPWPMCLDANEFEFLLSAIATFLRTLRKRKDAPDGVLGETLDDIYRKAGILLGPRAQIPKKFSATLQCLWGLQLPSTPGKSDLKDEKTSGNMCTASRGDQGKTEAPEARHQRWPAAAVDKPAAAHQGVP